MDISIKHTSWKNLPWSYFQFKLIQLQKRVYRAMQKTDIKQVIKLQKIILSSNCAYFLAVRSILQIHENNISQTNSLRQFFSDCSWNNKKINKLNLYKIIKSYETNEYYKQLFHTIAKYALEPIYESDLFIDNNYLKNDGNFEKIKKLVLISTIKEEKDEYSNSNKKLHYEIIKRLIFPLRYKLILLNVLDNITSNNYSKNSSLKLSRIILNYLHHYKKNFFITKRFVIPQLIFCPEISYISKINKTQYRLRKNLVENYLREKYCLIDFPNRFHLLNKKLVFIFQSKVLRLYEKSFFLIYKSKIKSILKNHEYSIKIRIRKVKILVRNFYEYSLNLRTKLFKYKLYFLKKWCRHYIKNHTNIKKDEINHLMKEMFQFSCFY